MDWKRYYRDEVLRPDRRSRMEAWLSAAPDERIDAALARGAILSFPHTALPFAGPLQASVVSALSRRGIERVLALGVLHANGRPAFHTALDPAADEATRRAAFEHVRGVFARGHHAVETPFGPLPTFSPPSCETGRDDLVADEFSLDTFFAFVRLGSHVFGRMPPQVCPVYVGMLRDPLTGSVGAARPIGRWLRRIDRRRTAIVTTGDLVHYGPVYGWSDEEMGAVERDAKVSLGEVLRRGVERALDDALRGSGEGGYLVNLRLLRNDQREILVLLADVLADRATYEILSFELSDYAPILSVRPPCWVASALVAYG